MMDKLVAKLSSRKLIVMMLWIVMAVVDKSMAQEIMPVVMAYIFGQGLADMAAKA